MSNYSDLSRAQLSFEYLHTNSTTHEFLFGALAELVDNSRDAGATRIDIYTVPDKSLRGGHMLCFLDDGEGMNPQQTSNVITFGCSIKKGMDSKLIGQYGNGLKSGSMRIGNDVIMFTKKENTMTCMMISRTFHEQEKIEEVIVPLPSFSAQNHAPLIEGKKKARDRHDLEMALILKYSPFHTQDELFAQFQKISGQSGSLVIIYNLKLLDSGECELDFKTDPHDILLTGLDAATDKKLVPQRHSFRSYVSILYSEPRMKMYIQGQKVQLIKFVNQLYKPRCYQYTSVRFKTRSKEESKKADHAAKDAKARAQEAEGNARLLEKQFLAHPTNKEGRAKLRTAQKDAAVCQEEAKIKEMIAEQKRKALKEPKTLSFIFGVNLENRNLDGLFIYNCCRLIKMYERIGPLLEDGISCRGVVGIVDVPYIVLEPTHNKQDFADAKEYRHLLRSLSEHLEQYWRDLGLGSNEEDIKLFWESYGYLKPSWDDPPSNEPKYVRKRAMQRNICIQCDACLKWRILPFSSSHIGMKFPDNWVCSMNSDISHNRCSAMEEKYMIPEGKLQKVEKVKPQKKELINEKIRKLEQQRNQILEEEEEEDMEAEEEEEEEEEEIRTKKKPLSSTRRKKPHVSPARKIHRSKSSEYIQKNSHSKPIRRRASSRVISRDDIEDSENDFTNTRDSDSVPEEVVEPVVKSRKTSREEIQKERIHNLSRRSSSESNNKLLLDVSKSTIEPLPKRPRRESSIKEESQKKEKEVADWDPWPDCSDDENDKRVTSKKYEIGTKVEARVKGKWYLGTISKISNSGYAQVKFDKFPDDKFDKQFSITSPDIKLPNFLTNSHGTLPSSSVIASSQEPALEMPSSSTSFANQNFEQLLDDISRGFRTCLHYFLPPEWTMDRDGINALSPQELSTFPLDDFFDHYEKGLRRLVESFREDAELHQKEAERAKTSQKNTSRLIARLLNSIHEECNLDPEKDLDKVDELLIACVEQAEQSASKSSQVSMSDN